MVCSQSVRRSSAVKGDTSPANRHRSEFERATLFVSSRFMTPWPYTSEQPRYFGPIQGIRYKIMVHKSKRDEHPRGSTKVPLLL